MPVRRASESFTAHGIRSARFPRAPFDVDVRPIRGIGQSAARRWDSAMTAPTGSVRLAGVESTISKGRASRRRVAPLDDVLVWRVLQLHRAGYDEDAVIALALAEEVDLHLAIDLRARGCPVETALRILL